MGWLLDPETVGIIPANTGRIPQTRRAASPQWDHPREYGENHTIQARKLSPGWDHPREYGENFWRCPCGQAVGGSSPRIRGESYVEE